VQPGWSTAGDRAVERRRLLLRRSLQQVSCSIGGTVARTPVGCTLPSIPGVTSKPRARARGCFARWPDHPAGGFVGDAGLVCVGVFIARRAPLGMHGHHPAATAPDPLDRLKCCLPISSATRRAAVSRCVSCQRRRRCALGMEIMDNQPSMRSRLFGHERIPARMRPLCCLIEARWPS